MKKIVTCVLMLVICLTFLIGCDASVAEADIQGRFTTEYVQTISMDGDIRIIIDNETGVKYLLYNSCQGDGITVMPNENSEQPTSNAELGEW